MDWTHLVCNMCEVTKDDRENEGIRSTKWGEMQYPLCLHRVEEGCPAIYYRAVSCDELLQYVMTTKHPGKCCGMLARPNQGVYVAQTDWTTAIINPLFRAKCSRKCDCVGVHAADYQGRIYTGRIH
jgi:hypothetical protein